MLRKLADLVCDRMMCYGEGPVVLHLIRFFLNLCVSLTVRHDAAMGGDANETKWSPGLGAKVLGVAPTADDSWVVSAAGPGFGICPDCSRRTRNWHGWSNRSLQDLPVQGEAVTVTVHALHKEGLSCSEKAKFSRERSRFATGPKKHLLRSLSLPKGTTR